MKTGLEDDYGDYTLEFKSKEEAEEVRELLEELLEAKRLHRCGTLFPGPPTQKAIDSME